MLRKSQRPTSVYSKEHTPVSWLKRFVVVRFSELFATAPMARPPALTFEPSVPFSRCNHVRAHAGPSPEVLLALARATWDRRSGACSDRRGGRAVTHCP